MHQYTVKKTPLFKAMCKHANLLKPKNLQLGPIHLELVAV